MDAKRKIHYLFLIFLSVVLVGCGGGNPIKLANLNNIQLNQDSNLEIDLNPLEPAATPYTYTIKTPPKYGTLSIGSDHRRWIYTPFRNYFGPDSFEFEATDGANKKSAKATLSVNEIFIAGRPMTVKFLELTSPAPGELQAIWFNSYDIDGDVAALRYHVYLSTDKDFYPSDQTLVETLQGAVTTTLRGLVEDETYYIAILAEDIDGKLSKRIDKREVKLIASRLVFRDNIQVVSVANLPVTSVMLEETEVILTLSAPVQNMAGKVLQLDEANDYAFLKLDSAASISPNTHRYRYSIAPPQEFIRDLAFTLNQGTYDPAGALIEYYQDTAGSLDSLMAGRSGMVSVAAAGPGYLSDLLQVLLSEWTQFRSIDELYAFLVQGTTININEYKSDEESCGSLPLTFEPLDPLGWKPDPAEFNVTLKFECDIAYTIKVRWNDILRNSPELLSAEINGSIATSFDVSGRLTGRFNLLTKELPRNMQFVKTKAIKLWIFPIPYTIALNLKGTLQGEAYGELTGTFGTVVTADINAGVEYKSGAGFRSLGTGLSIENTLPKSTKEAISQIELSAKAGIELAARVGPEAILSLANVHWAYKRGFDGVATLKTHAGAGLAVSVELEENPKVLVEDEVIKASRFGISAYEWSGRWGGDYELALHLPIAAKTEFSLNVVDIPFRHLPAFDIEYNDARIGSKEFEVAAVKSDYFTWNDAKLVTGATRWHVIKPDDAVLTQNSVDPLQASGLWTTQYEGDSIIVLEYTPDTLATMVAGLSSVTKPIAKQYKLFMPAFLLEGEWDYQYTRFDVDIMRIVQEGAKNLTELYKGTEQETLVKFEVPPCDFFGSPIVAGVANFTYDSVNRNYWLADTVTEHNLKTHALKDIKLITGSGGLPGEVTAETLVLTFDCISPLSSILPVTTDAERVNRYPVNRAMNATELKNMFAPNPGGADGVMSAMDGIIAGMLLSGGMTLKHDVELVGPDEFIARVRSAISGYELFDFEIKYRRKMRQAD